MKKALLALALAGLMGVYGCTFTWPAWWPWGGGDGPGPLYVNVQVDAEEITAEGEGNVTGLNKIMAELAARGITTTIYVTGGFANNNSTLISQYANAGHEIALHGQETMEKLSTMTYEEQKTRLQNALSAVKGCEACGLSHPVVGFRPQGFTQDNNTFQVVDELGLEYNSGFKAGVLADTDDHKATAAPYKLTSYNAYAVPITTVDYDGKTGVYLCDMSSMYTNMTGEKFSGLLQAGITKAETDKAPLTLIIHGGILGNTDKYKDTQDYWQPFLTFLDTLQAKSNVEFVTTKELVDLYKSQAQ